MKIVIYIIRFLLAFIFIYAGVEKLFLPYNPSVFKADTAMTDPMFFEFYNLLQEAGYLYFVGFFQLLCGVLLVFKRTYVLASIMLVPLILCLLMTQVFISKYMAYIIFDATMLLLNIVIMLYGYSKWKGILSKTEKRWI